MRFQDASRRGPLIASEVAAGSPGVQAMCGLSVIVLGILAVCGVYTGPLTLVALLVAGASIVLTGSTLTGTMVGFMRDAPAASTTADSADASDSTDDRNDPPVRTVIENRDSACGSFYARSFNRRPIAARSSAMPAPLCEEVASISGKAAGRRASPSATAARRSLSSAALMRSHLGQHDLITDGRLIQCSENILVGRHQAVARVDQQINPRERRPAAQEIVNEFGPRADLALRRRREAIARHIDQHERPGSSAAGERR